MGNSSEYIYGFITKSQQGIYACMSHDNTIGLGLLGNGVSGAGDLSLINRIAGDKEILFVGAHIGTLAIPSCHRFKHVTAIEANPETYKFLKVNVILNELENINIYQAAAHADKRTISFIAGEGNSGGSKIYPENPHPHYLETKHKIVKLETVRLDELLQAKEFEVIVMDIEGSEIFALRGMPILLKKSKILFIEFITFHLEYVAAVSPEEFASELTPYYKYVYIPGKNTIYENSQFSSLLRSMYDERYHQDLIVFTKELSDAESLLVK